MSYHSVLLIMSIIGMSSFVHSQTLTSDQVKDLIGKARKKFAIPAIALTVMNSDSVYVNEVEGVRIVETTDKVSSNDLFHIGSCSKSVLAVAAGKLIESGMLSWHVKFFDLFPELREASNAAYLEITMEDLFLCKAGIQPYTAGEEEFPEIDPQASSMHYEFVRYLLKQLPSSKSTADGKFEHLYSNASYTMIAMMLERIDGLTYEERVRDLLTGHFGIQFYIGFPNKFSNSQPWGHQIEGREIRKFPPDDAYELHHLLTPAGDLSMTPTSFARYIQFHLNGLNGRDNYLQSSTIKQIHFGHQGFSLAVGNGRWAGHNFSGMDGSAGTFFCRAILIPQSDFAFTIMMNAGSGTGRMKAVDWLTAKIVKQQYNWWWKFWL